MSDQEFTAEQAAAANRALRAAIDLPPQRFSAEQFVGMISDEIEQLRGAGFSDEKIVRLLRESTGANLDPSALQRFYVPKDRRGGWS